MAVPNSAPPTIPRKKSGLGCLGCGCVVLALIGLLFVLVFGSIGYVAYNKTMQLTSPTAEEVPGYAGGDETLKSVQQKLAAFDEDVKNHKASTLQLTADEVNALLANNPNIVAKNIKVHATLADNAISLKGSAPTESISEGLLRGRFVNIDASFGLSFDADSKRLMLTPRTIEVGGSQILPLADSSDQQSATMLASMVASFNQSFNDGLHKDPNTARVINQAKSIEVKDGQLVIETQ